jgi:RNA polymerase sigma factor (sigma-70 family)
VKRAEIIQLRPHAHAEEISDAGLVAACAAGDRAARAMLFERHVDVVHGFIARMRCADADAVDDLAQASFLRAFRAAARFRGTSARSWLLGIAANVVKEHARTEIRRKRALGAIAKLWPRSAEPSDPSVARLPAAIAALPHKLRAAFVLVDLEGERGIDAAAALDIPEGTLWRRVHDARTRLRASLGDER